MKQTNLSTAGIFFGLCITLGTWIRYFVLYPDPDKAIFFGLIGLIIVVISWNYAGRIQLDDDIKNLETKVNCVEEYIQVRMAI